MNLSLPVGALADAALTLLRTLENRPIEDHSLRSFHFARLIAAHEGCLTDAAYDEDLLFAATLLHDLGLGSLAPGKTRFEIEGADLAAALLSDHGVAEADIARVWEAIALHTSMGLAERMGLLTYLTHKAVFTDAGRATGLPPELLAPVRAAYPKPPDDTSIPDAIVTHARRSPSAAPPYSIAAELLRQRL
ncbi:HD domain-containing protein [Herbidospora sp. RD11066]